MIKTFEDIKKIKLPIVVVVAFVVQVCSIVWYVASKDAERDNRITYLEKEVSELMEHASSEEISNIQRDITDLSDELVNLDQTVEELEDELEQ